MSEGRNGSGKGDHRLALIVVAGVTAVFVIVTVASLWMDRPIDSGLYGVMGIVAGGVLGYGVLMRR